MVENNIINICIIEIISLYLIIMKNASQMKNQKTQKSKVYQKSHKIYCRVITESENLKKEDYICGFGLDSSHYSLVRKAREEWNENNEDKLPLSSDFKEDYDSREGYHITGKKIETKYHPWHDKELVKKETGEIYIIDSVHRQFYYGFYWMILARKKGTKSHTQIIWECETGSYWKEAAQKSKEKYKMK